MGALVAKHEYISVANGQNEVLLSTRGHDRRGNKMVH
jgi:hypothetical protein